MRKEWGQTVSSGSSTADIGRRAVWSGRVSGVSSCFTSGSAGPAFISFSM